MYLFRKIFERHPDIVLPTAFLCIYIVFFFVAGQFLFQNTEAIMNYIRILYSQYGLILVFVGGFLETLFMVGIYLPASLTIALGILVDPTFNGIFWVSVMCIVSAFFANLFNFVIGKYGLVKFFNFLGAKQVLQAQSKKDNSHTTILLSCINPNLLGITVVYHALKGMNFNKLIYLSFLSTLIWVPILATIAFFVGEKLFQSNSVYVFLLLFIIWILYLIISNEIKMYLQKK